MAQRVKCRRNSVGFSFAIDKTMGWRRRPGCSRLWRASHSRQFPAIKSQGRYPSTLTKRRRRLAIGARSTQPSLQTAKAFFVICTPGTYARQGDGDWVHREIDWWLRNRTSPPILIETGKGEGRWIPESIRKRWPHVQRVNLDLEKYRNSEPEARSRLSHQVVTQITHGVILGASREVFEELERTKRSNRIIRSISMGLAVALVMAVVLGLLVAKEKGKVVEERKTAVAKQLAAQALLEVDRHFDLALLLSAYCAERTGPGPGHALQSSQCDAANQWRCAFSLGTTRRDH